MPVESVSLLESVRQHLEESGSSHGYRNVQQRLMKRGIQYSNEAVRIALNVLDPGGGSLRRSHKLKRRKYRNTGPNHLWDIYGNDKLKPFGFMYMYIIWLHVANTRKDPAVLACYFLMKVKVINESTTKIRRYLEKKRKFRKFVCVWHTDSLLLNTVN